MISARRILGVLEGHWVERLPRPRCRRAWGLVFWFVMASPWACRNDDATLLATAKPEPSTSAASEIVIGPPSPPPTPRQGMLWIEGGALVLGTPPDVLPRKADEEMQGEQVILQSYYIDAFPYPNEEGAIPLTNVTRDEARALCAARDKRLCSELEWERACKGPGNHVYEYGDKYRSDVCGTGAPPSLRPSGLEVGCHSDFGVRDLHGGAFEWTESPWGRGTKGELFTVRGGNGTAGEIVGRCANGEGKKGSTKSETIGFRCCAGPANEAVVELRVKKGRTLDLVERFDSKLARRLLESLPAPVRESFVRAGAPSVDRIWLWRPVGNEEIVLASVCSRLAARPVCGLAIARDKFEQSTFVAWAPTGALQTTVYADNDARELWISGGDEHGRYRRLVAYAWGRIQVHESVQRVVTQKRSPQRPAQ